MRFGGSHSKNTNAVWPDLAGEFCSSAQRDFITIEQSDGPAEERYDIRTRVREGEYSGVLQEEWSFLRKEERKARQVDLTIINFCFREVGVERCRPFQTRCDVVENVDARFSAQVIAGIDVMKSLARDERPHVKPSSLIDFL